MKRGHMADGESFRFTGSGQQRSQRWYGAFAIGVDDDGVTVTFGEVMEGLLNIAVHSGDPIVIRFFLKVYVAGMNYLSSLNAMPDTQRRFARRRELEKRKPRVHSCPECHTTGELFIMDRMVPCPKCDGLGWIR